MSIEYDYIAIGHVTRDVIEDAPGQALVQPGGSAFYGALQAARLGLRALIVTRGAPTDIQQLLKPYRQELDVEIQSAGATTTLATRGAGTQRVQRVLAWAGPIESPRLQASAKIVHFAPVAREITAWEGRCEGSFVGVTPQGMAREWGADGRIWHVPLDLPSLPERFDAAVINERELENCTGLFEAASKMDRRPPIAVTAGSAPISVHLADGTVEAIAPIEVTAVREDLGAGDVFAATFFVALADAKPAAQAARMGSAAAALRVGGLGPDAVARESAIATLLAA